MKNRNLITNILSIIILIALIFFLLVQFNIFKVSDPVKSTLILVSLGVAVVSVVLMDIVFPIIDNKHRLVDRRYMAFFLVKVVLFTAAIIALLLFHPIGVLEATPALIAFIVLYFAQFFINLDAKPYYEDEEDEEEIVYKDDFNNSDSIDIMNFGEKNSSGSSVSTDAAQRAYSGDKSNLSAVLDMEDIDDIFKDDN